jgi:hypothetical protein
MTAQKERPTSVAPGCRAEPRPRRACLRVSSCPSAGRDVIIFHGTTVDRLASIRREGLRPRSFVSRSRELAGEYAWHRAMTVGADGCVVIELDVPSSAIVEAQSWWWARDQLQLPAGCPASCIVSVDDSDPRPFPVD